MSKIEGGRRGITFYDLGDFTIDPAGKGEFKLHAKEKAANREGGEITWEEAQAALRKWGILNGLTRLPLTPAERYIRRIKVARSYEVEGEETFARAYYELAVREADRGGIQVDLSRLKDSFTRKRNSGSLPE